MRVKSGRIDIRRFNIELFFDVYLVKGIVFVHLFSVPPV